MEPSVNNIQGPEQSPEILPTIVSIDESWLVSSEIGIKQNLLICPVCYTIPLDHPIQCSKCERIFCRTDYDKVLQSQNQDEKRCPTCKLSPWRKKQQIHLSYKHMFDSLKLKCKICQESQVKKESQMQNEPIIMSKDQLLNHLQKMHNMILSMEAILYDFTFIPEQGDELKLTEMQNLEINVRRGMNYQTFDIGGSGGKLYNINLKEMKAFHPTLGSCRIKSYKSQTLKRNKQYIVWTVDLGQNSRYDDDFQYEPPINNVQSYFNPHSNQRYVFYSEELQPIVERNYQQFVKNIRYNVFCLDVRDYRFIINFATLSQVNTFTKNKKTILRVPIKLK